MSTVIGRCIEEHDLSPFRFRHWKNGLFRPGNGGHHFTVKPLEDYLPGQRDLPQEVIEFQDGTTALVALEISRKWEGTTLVKWWRVIYLHPKLKPLFLQEVGQKLRDIPIGENERFPPEENEEEILS